MRNLLRFAEDRRGTIFSLTRRRVNGRMVELKPTTVALAGELLFARRVDAVVVPSIAHAAPPANDAFASPERTTGTSGTVFGTSVGATSEPVLRFTTVAR
jgi:hypothetical protein